MSETHVWVYNPETDAKWESPVDYLPVALARGWELTDPPADEYPAAPAPAEAEVEFDPGEHTVAEVEAYVQEHPDDVDRVLDAERAGKNRVTLTGDASEDDAESDE
jgi:hypothetical protein